MADRALLSFLAMASISIGQTTPAPALPFLDWKACPFEGCAYREWTANKPVTAYDTWKEDRRALAQLGTGEKVTGVTGVVITFKPGIARMDRDLGNLHRGDTILTYTYRGEGVSAVWFNGRFDPDFDLSFAKLPDGTGCGGEHCAATIVDLGMKVWWAQVKLKDGRMGWVKMDGMPFDGVDLLAGNRVRSAPQEARSRF
ncbi:MAG TPA: hypothetical protein VNX18_12085 [Bryobacteraceae bacterium]|jgi:hypothetical protein|nr:hypothetical protein [Bryobacteraceae bacterium]